ncbi:MAG: DUF5818 domain-containing protein [Acidobacteriota bacterium]|nr:DUF5818 domain-containing protein [Acidobacteriota bacterium]
MQALVLGFFVTAALVGAQGQQTFIGTVTDDMCANGDHFQMRMSSTDAECTIACIFAHGSLYVLYDGTDVYTLSDQQAAEAFAGKRVRVTGNLDGETKTIQVDSIAAAE